MRRFNEVCGMEMRQDRIDDLKATDNSPDTKDTDCQDFRLRRSGIHSERRVSTRINENLAYRVYYRQRFVPSINWVYKASGMVSYSSEDTRGKGARVWGSKYLRNIQDGNAEQTPSLEADIRESRYGYRSKWLQKLAWRTSNKACTLKALLLAS